MTAINNDPDYFQTYLEKLEEDEDDELNNEVIQSIKNDFVTEVDDNGSVDEEKEAEDRGAIIMDAEGNYYFQTSKEIVKVEPISKVSQAPAAVVTPNNKRKPKAQAASVSTKKTKLSNNKSVKKENNNVKPADETANSEFILQEEVYEFDENEQDPDDPGVEPDADYGSKGLLKSAKKSSANEEATFICMLCPYQTAKKFLLSRHLKKHSDERPYKCTVCERGFKTNSSLMNHRNTHLGVKPHACKDCDMAFTTSGELVRHVRYRHTHIKPHKCTECDYSSVEMSKLRRHMRCHTGERPYQCPHCTYASPDTFKLKRHMRIHTGEKPYECDICHARFTQSNSLKLHRLIHSVNEKPVFQCHLCPTTCGRKTDLRLHIKKLHSSDQPIPCKRCGKELPDRYSYKMHLKTHEGEKCFRCDYCPYASISERHLESHLHIHLDKKPFICEICNTSFRQKPLLVRHMKIYHSDNYEPPQSRKKDHKCPHCNKMFAFNGNLMRHMEIHDPTSDLMKKKEALKVGRMTRVRMDGTVVALPPTNCFMENNSEYGYDDNNIGEEQQQQQIDDDEVIPEEGYEDEEEEEAEDEEYNEENIQYVYDELEADEYVEQEYEEQLEEATDEKSLIDVKMEKLETIVTPQPALKQSIILKGKDNEAKIMSLEVNDDQDFMVIEVLPDDDDDEEESQEVIAQVQPQPVKSTTANKNTNKATVIKTQKKAQSLISDYFGFEVDQDDDDDETKGDIKLLEMIEQE
ncbi:transcriptional repressor CTCF [Lucilia sericata]|uniref:transcriptional repressor CTCF n=1 Tax=Lucilia sericata TaxID=13632 RepID=UPI0018A83278|nr:transcriptional repressor CTCF [Lucilia sericata]